MLQRKTVTGTPAFASRSRSRIVRPLARPVADGVARVHRALSPERGRVLVLPDRIGPVEPSRDAHAGDEADGGEAAAQREARHLRRAEHVRLEELRVREGVVHQRAVVHDGVHLAGEGLPPRLREAEAGLDQVARDHLEPPLPGERREARRERRVDARVGAREALARRPVVGGPHDRDDLPAGTRHARQELQEQEAPEEAVRAREQGDPRRRQRLGGRLRGEVPRVEEALDAQVLRLHRLRPGAVHLGEARPPRRALAAPPLLDVAREGAHAARRVEHEADGHVHAGEVLDEPREPHAAQRVAPELHQAEVLLARLELGQPERDAERPRDLLLGRTILARLPLEGVQLLELRPLDRDEERFQPLAVAGPDPGARGLVALGQEPVLAGEGLFAIRKSRGIS